MAKKGPVMITYNMHQHTYPSKKSNAWKDSEQNIIQPEYSPIYWQTKMDNIRKETIEECKKHTETIVKTAIDNQNKIMHTELKQLRDEKKNMSHMISAIFTALQPVITQQVLL